MTTQTKLHRALDAYRGALLEFAIGDLAGRKAGVPCGRPTDLIQARDNVLDAAKGLDNEAFIAACMANNFLRG